MAPPLLGGLSPRADNGLSSESGRGLRVEEALPASIAGVLTSLVATSFVFHFLGGSGWICRRLQRPWLRQKTVRRYRQVSKWRSLSYSDWRESLPWLLYAAELLCEFRITDHATTVILALFVDSWLFFAASTILQFGGFDVNVDSRACAAGSYMCVVGYFVSKVNQCIISYGYLLSWLTISKRWYVV